MQQKCSANLTNLLLHKV